MRIEKVAIELLVPVELSYELMEDVEHVGLSNILIQEEQDVSTQHAQVDTTWTEMVYAQYAQIGKFHILETEN